MRWSKLGSLQLENDVVDSVGIFAVEVGQRCAVNGKGHDNDALVPFGPDQNISETRCKIAARAVGTQQRVNGGKAFPRGRVKIVDGLPRCISARPVVGRVALTMDDDDRRLAGERIARPLNPIRLWKSGQIDLANAMIAERDGCGADQRPDNQKSDIASQFGRLSGAADGGLSQRDQPTYGHRTLALSQSAL